MSSRRSSEVKTAVAAAAAGFIFHEASNVAPKGGKMSRSIVAAALAADEHVAFIQGMETDYQSCVETRNEVILKLNKGEGYRGSDGTLSGDSLGYSDAFTGLEGPGDGKGDGEQGKGDGEKGKGEGGRVKFTYQGSYNAAQRGKYDGLRAGLKPVALCGRHANYYPKGHAKAGRCHPYHKIANLRLLGVVSHPPGYETGASGAIRKSRAGRSIPKGPRFEFEVMNVTRDTLRADPARFLMP